MLQGWTVPDLKSFLDLVIKDGPLEAIRAKTQGILAKVAGRRHIMNLGQGIDYVTAEEHAAFFIHTVQS